MQCQGPSCQNEIEQVSGGHRTRKYCSDACRVAAHRLRQEKAKQVEKKTSQEAFLVEQEAREQAARERLHARFGDLLPQTMELLVDLSERSFHSALVDAVGEAIVRERNWARQSAAAERGALSEEIMLVGESLGFPYIAIEELDLLAGIANWSNACEYGSLERLRQVREAVQIRQRAMQRRMRLSQ